MEFTKGNIYYPYNPFITKSSTYYDNEIKEGLMSVVAEFEYKDQRYRLVVGPLPGLAVSVLTVGSALPMSASLVVPLERLHSILVNTLPKRSLMLNMVTL